MPADAVYFDEDDDAMDDIGCSDSLTSRPELYRRIGTDLRPSTERAPIRANRFGVQDASSAKQIKMATEFNAATLPWAHRTEKNASSTLQTSTAPPWVCTEPCCAGCGECDNDDEAATTRVHKSGSARDDDDDDAAEAALVAKRRGARMKERRDTPSTAKAEQRVGVVATVPSGRASERLAAALHKSTALAPIMQAAVRGHLTRCRLLAEESTPSSRPDATDESGRTLPPPGIPIPSLPPSPSPPSPPPPSPPPPSPPSSPPAPSPPPSPPSDTTLPPTASIVIVGGGVAGLTLAGAFFEACPDLVLLERGAKPGGVWRTLATSTSVANVSQPAYSLAVPPRSREDRATRHEMLADVQHVHEHLARNIVCNVCARSITRHEAASKKWTVSARITTSPSHQELTCDWVLLAVGGRLGAPRPSLFTPDHKSRFVGVLRRAHDECTRAALSGARVGIIGCGPFALEHVRSSLEHDAAHVSIICRRAGLVVPLAIEHLSHRRPSNVLGEVELPRDIWQPTTAALGYAWAQCYALSGALVPEGWANQDECRPDGHGTSLSDIWYVGSYLGVIDATLMAPSARGKPPLALTPNGIVVTGGGGTRTTACLGAPSGDRLVECEVIVECIGFERPGVCERLVGRTHMVRHGRVDNGLWALSEPHADSQATLAPFYSYLSYVQAITAQVVRTWRGEDPLEVWFHPEAWAVYDADFVESAFQRVRISGHTVTEILGELEQGAMFDGGLREGINEHLKAVRRAFDARGTPAVWVTENRRQWAALHASLRPRAPMLRHLVSLLVSLPYPFAHALRLVEAEICEAGEAMASTTCYAGESAIRGLLPRTPGAQVTPR